MASNALFAEIAALAGDPARASMLHALMDGRALTATELARAAGITPQTASGHLRPDDRGRPAERREAGAASLSPAGDAGRWRACSRASCRWHPSWSRDRRGFTVGPRDAALRKARTCYDHFAGRLGVALADALIERGHVELTSDAGILTDAGMAFLGRDRDRYRPMLARRTKRVGPRSLPAVPRLERAAAAPRRRGRRRDLRPQHGTRAGPADWTAPAPCSSRQRENGSFARRLAQGSARQPPARTSSAANQKSLSVERPDRTEVSHVAHGSIPSTQLNHQSRRSPAARRCVRFQRVSISAIIVAHSMDRIEDDPVDGGGAQSKKCRIGARKCALAVASAVPLPQSW